MYLLQFISFIILMIVFAPNNAVGFRNRIIGGSETSISQYPYVTSIHYQGAHICGGAIIAQRFVVTAAHCVIDTHKYQLVVIVGSTSASSGVGNRHEVELYKIHERYNDITTDFDIGIIKVSGTFDFGATMQPVPVANVDDSLPTGAMATVTGWGFTREDGSIVKTLHQAKVPLLSHSKCKQIYHKIAAVTNNMICAGMGGSDACQGDSGGPLVYHGKLVGLISWGYGCARPDFPGVYTNVANFHKWLHTNTKTL